ncbi:nuclear transport factor 2 family protein [Chloroflexota bacterium]
MSLEEMQARVRKLQDIEDIKKLHRKYIFMLSNYQWSDMVECFSKNAVADLDPDGKYIGKEEIRKLIVGVIGERINPLRPKGGQILDQPIIIVDGDKATGIWFMNRYNSNDTTKEHWRIMKQYYNYPETVEAKPPQISRGKYDAEYVREDGEWKFHSLKWNFPWPRYD